MADRKSLLGWATLSLIVFLLLAAYAYVLRGAAGSLAHWSICIAAGGALTHAASTFLGAFALKSLSDHRSRWLETAIWIGRAAVAAFALGMTGMFLDRVGVI